MRVSTEKEPKMVAQKKKRSLKDLAVSLAHGAAPLSPPARALDTLSGFTGVRLLGLDHNADNPGQPPGPQPPSPHVVVNGVRWPGLLGKVMHSCSGGSRDSLTVLDPFTAVAGAEACHIRLRHTTQGCWW